MKKILPLLWLFCATAFGANGDVVSAEILDNGWQMRVGMTAVNGTNGTFAMGYDTNNLINGLQKVSLSVNRPGWNSNGTSNMVTETVYGTKEIRFPDPDEAFKDTTNIAGVVYVKVGLSKFIAPQDVATATFLAGFYTGSGVPNAAASGVAVVNSSAQPFVKPTMGWAWPGNRLITNNSLKLSVVGFHVSAANGKPLEAVHFIVTDESGDSVSNIVTAMTVDRTMSDALPFGAFNTTLDISSLTHSNLLVCRFRGFGRVGNVLFDSETDELVALEPNVTPGNQTNFYMTNAYASVAVVGSVGASPQPYPHGTDPTTIPTTAYFANYNAALVACKATNNTHYGHNDDGGSKVWGRTGSTTWQGGSGTTTGVPKVWVEILEYPGDTLVLDTESGNTDVNDMVYMNGIEIAAASTTRIFNTVDQVWLDQVHLNGTGSGPITVCKVVHLTRSTGAQWTMGLRSVGNQNQAWGIVRGNDITINATITPQVFVGNIIRASGTSCLLTYDASPFSATGPTRRIWYNNILYGMTANASTAVAAGVNLVETNGMVIAQLVIECLGATPSVSFFGGINHSTNIINWHNLIRGARHQQFYNELGSTPVWRIWTSSKNNIVDAAGWASDYNGTQNGARIGNWSVMWGVEYSGYISQQLSGATVHGAPEFVGVNSYFPASGGSSPLGWARFVDEQATGNGGGSAGNGDYRLLNDSPIRSSNYRHEWVLPFDILGNPRTADDPAGPYAGSFYTAILSGRSTLSGSATLK